MYTIKETEENLTKATENLEKKLEDEHHSLKEKVSHMTNEMLYLKQKIEDMDRQLDTELVAADSRKKTEMESVDAGELGMLRSCLNNLDHNCRLLQTWRRVCNSS